MFGCDFDDRSHRNRFMYWVFINTRMHSFACGDEIFVIVILTLTTVSSWVLISGHQLRLHKVTTTSVPFGVMHGAWGIGFPRIN